MKTWQFAIAAFLAGVLSTQLAYLYFQSAAPQPTPSAQTSSRAAQPTHRPAQTDVAQSAPASTASQTSSADDDWQAVTETLSELQARIAALEARPSAPSPHANAAPVARPSDTPGANLDQDTLVAAGVDPYLASDFLQRRNQLEMQRLELRDQASREGWLGTSRFAQALRELQDNVGTVREEIGDDAYDRFLYLSGQSNRVGIASVIEGSSAQAFGIEAGDLILSYAGQRVFSYPELVSATRGGERGEYILVGIERDGERLEINVPRGPLGVRLDSRQVAPDADS